MFHIFATKQTALSSFDPAIQDDLAQCFWFFTGNQTGSCNTRLEHTCKYALRSRMEAKNAESLNMRSGALCHHHSLVKLPYSLVKLPVKTFLH